MTGLDYSIITVALPEIGRDLGFGATSGLQWVVTACLLPTAALMPLLGRASDMVGRGVAGSLAQMPTFIGAIGVAGRTAIVTARTQALVHATTKTLATLGGLHIHPWAHSARCPTRRTLR
jgi:MFS family permease